MNFLSASPSGGSDSAPWSARRIALVGLVLGVVVGAVVGYAVAHG